MTYPPQQGPPPGPGWTPQPASPARKWKIAGIGIGGLLAAFIVLGIIGAIVGPAKKTAASSPAGTVSTPTAAASATMTTEAAVPSPSAIPTVVPTSKAAAPVPTPAPKKTTAKPKATQAECDPGPDVIVWYRVATLEDQAQLLGSRGYPNCSSTFDMIQNTSPTDAGDCTEAAWASDNPGYNADATPAKRLKKVQVSVGPAC